ncbi:MAG: Fe-S cluster protein [Proteobacteria bacterium]|nr:Fe-S cluster protein [Pseudomonadota bacterium]
MILKNYTKKIFRVECNPGFEGVHCIAQLEQDVGEVLPYLNATLGGFEYLKDPPAVTFKTHGKLITVEARQIAVNALKDDMEADKILEWLKREINDAWENRNDIVPSEKGLPKPNLIEILKILPKTNCKKCGAPTCMVFATQIAEGAKTQEDCPQLEEEGKSRLMHYLKEFKLDDLI